jgi:hypothetical protein
MCSASAGWWCEVATVTNADMMEMLERLEKVTGRSCYLEIVLKQPNMPCNEYKLYIDRDLYGQGRKGIIVGIMRAIALYEYTTWR